MTGDGASESLKPAFSIHTLAVRKTAPLLGLAGACSILERLRAVPAATEFRSITWGRWSEFLTMAYPILFQSSRPVFKSAPFSGNAAISRTLAVWEALIPSPDQAVPTSAREAL